MTTQNGISPAKYWRESKNWQGIIGRTGVVLAATRIEVGLPELAESMPYWLVLIKYDDSKIKPSLGMFIGADGYSYKENDRIICVLRRFSSEGVGLIHYGIKVIPT